jgi:hypothetical protein
MRKAREDFIAILQTGKYHHRRGWNRSFDTRETLCGKPIACAIRAWALEQADPKLPLMEATAYDAFTVATGLSASEIFVRNDSNESYEKVINYVQCTIERDFPDEEAHTSASTRKPASTQT